ncbi:Protein of unknown function [Catalinimonas alkaloidigena]|uniref:DUF3891 domain-containing protein n=1 Tax=Catalinimonas alkaloidigena TaxID=1075417 RepID=A0A1G9K7J8_9BACT|nr:DUF3891 family protein [Catalinimonas alkaloidigena]SDL45870.1 Protein of unknown function [Catalinimonas alkaloidigena]
MIVNPIATGWEIIFQRAHGLLAVQLAHRWRKDQRPERWIETLAAITEHDDGQEGWHARAHLNQAGSPLNFAEQDFPEEQARRIALVSRYKSRWTALLISHHLSFLYERFRGQHATIDAFLDEQQQHQIQWRKELGYTKKEVEAAYRLLRWCDQCSLILGQQQLPPGERALEVEEGPDRTHHFIRQRADQSVVVEPWPFEEDDFWVEIETRALHQLTFADDQALMQALHEAPVTLRRWQFKK